MAGDWPEIREEQVRMCLMQVSTTLPKIPSAMVVLAGVLEQILPD
jgi:hypothetical protein